MMAVLDTVPTAGNWDSEQLNSFVQSTGYCFGIAMSMQRQQGQTMEKMRNTHAQYAARTAKHLKINVARIAMALKPELQRQREEVSNKLNPKGMWTPSKKKGDLLTFG